MLFDIFEMIYNIFYDMVDEFVVMRDFDLIVDFVFGLILNMLNVNQVVINGVMVYDNVWLMEGVEINDNFFGLFDSFFIEDVI